MKSVSRVLLPLAAGLLFGAGLVVSGMTKPRKVIGFLDLFGAWDPSLLFVMAGAIGVYALARYAASALRLRRLDAGSLAPGAPVDAKLVAGSAIFGIGWGLGGYCPGPSVVSLASGALPVLLFFGMSCVGALLASGFEARLRRTEHAPVTDLEPGR